MKILVTGFPKYADQELNPSESILPRINRDDVLTLLLPVEYDGARELLRQTIEKENPDAIIVLALSPFVARPILETYGYNEMDTTQPDEAGVIKHKEPIVKNGPASLPASYDLFSIQQYVLSQGEKVDISIDPGRFVANAVFYEALHSKKPSLMLHLPKESKYSLDDTLETLNRILDYIDY